MVIIMRLCPAVLVCALLSLMVFAPHALSADDAQIVADWNGHRIDFQVKEGDKKIFTFRPYFHLAADAVFPFTYDDTDEVNPIAQLPNYQLFSGAGFRYLRMGFRGSAFGFVDYRIRLDFTPDPSPIESAQIALADAFLRFRGELGDFSDGSAYEIWLDFGQTREPFGLDEATGAERRYFMENSITNAFVPGRSTGVQLHNYFLDGLITLKLGAFVPTDRQGTGFRSDFGNNGSFGQSWAFTSRLYTSIPFIESETGPEMHVHLGGAFSYRLPQADRGVPIRPRALIRSAPESHWFQDTYVLVNTGGAPGAIAEPWTLFNAEAYYSFGPLSVQGEYFGSMIFDFTDGQRYGDDNMVYQQGFHATARFVVTGESIPFQYHRGSPGVLVPCSNFLSSGPEKEGQKCLVNGLGAIDVALRYSLMDLRPAAGSQDLGALTGTDNWVLNFAVNWTVNQFARIQTNFLMFSSDVLTENDATNQLQDQAFVFQLRAEFFMR